MAGGLPAGIILSTCDVAIVARRMQRHNVPVPDGGLISGRVIERAALNGRVRSTAQSGGAYCSTTQAFDARAIVETVVEAQDAVRTSLSHHSHMQGVPRGDAFDRAD